MQYLCLHFRPDVSGRDVEPATHVRWCAASGGTLGDDDASIVVKVEDGQVRVYDVVRLNRPDRLEHYWIIQARDLNDAIRLGGRLLSDAGGYLEVRPIIDIEQQTMETQD